MAQLVLKHDIFPGGQLVVADTELPRTIGRSRRADITIPDQLLSRIHAELRRSDTGGFEIVDNESTNLTIINDQDIERAELRTGDRLLLGETEILVEITSARHNPEEKTTRELPLLRPRRTTDSDRADMTDEA
jgi:S-DNA-T family DNA segregation ATPase FtsK/SpoIIIE